MPRVRPPRTPAGLAPNFSVFQYEILQGPDKVIQLVPHERIQRRIDEESIDVLVQQVMEDVIEVVKLIPQERGAESHSGANR